MKGRDESLSNFSLCRISFRFAVAVAATALSLKLPSGLLRECRHEVKLTKSRHFRSSVSIKHGKNLNAIQCNAMRGNVMEVKASK
jgi:hypothetical protein